MKRASAASDDVEAELDHRIGGRLAEPRLKSQVRAIFRSQSFNQFLAAKCAWNDQIERETFSGKRSIDDLKQMMRCRDRATQEAARQALVLARTETSGRGLGQTIKAPN